MAQVSALRGIRAAPRPEMPSERSSARWFALPSWFISLAIHVGVLFALATLAGRPAGFGGPNAIECEFLGSGGPGGSPGDGNSGPPGPGLPDALDTTFRSPGTKPGDAATDTLPSSPSGMSRDDGPPVELELPVVSAPRPGPAAGGGGVIRGPRAAGTVARGVSGGRGFGPGGGGGIGTGAGAGRGSGGGGGGTSFFGQKAVGARYVYVLDASGSMYDYNAIAVAKAELLASIEQLDETQQFLVIFYNEKAHPMPGPDGRSELAWGTDTNRAIAAQFIRSVQPDGGTRHLEALLLALTHSPDVIFFLTDAGEPVLTAGELDKIKRSNNGRARIHTVEFGKGASLRIDNFIKQLARENGGAHVYRDVTKFRRERE